MRYADAGSVRTAYDDEGPRADDAVVFLGGWCNSGRSFFAPLAERWLPGIGSSGWTGADTGIPAGRPRTSATTNWPTMRWSSSRQPVSAVWCRYQAHGGWPALRLRRLLGKPGAPCVRLRNSTRNLTCCTCTPSRAPPGSSPASKSSRPRIRGFRPGG